MARPAVRSGARRSQRRPEKHLTIASERTHAIGRERSRQIDKLGVTGSSPVPPISIYERTRNPASLPTSAHFGACVLRGWIAEGD
jgi:hypothetical protein